MQIAGIIEYDYDETNYTLNMVTDSIGPQANYSKYEMRMTHKVHSVSLILLSLNLQSNNKLQHNKIKVILEHLRKNKIN